MVGLAILFVSFLAALRCMTAEIAELARSEPQDSWIGTCLNFHHFDIQSWLPCYYHRLLAFV